MNDTQHTRVTLARRPSGMAVRDDFALVSAPLPEPGPGEFRVRLAYVSLDPAMRGWMNDVKSYVPPLALGDTMRGFSAGYVETSNNPDFAPGDPVAGLFGVQSHAISDGRGVAKCDLALAPLERWIGGLGMPGITAYFGTIDIAKPQPGETVVVSAASGAVGALVGQIAKMKGARTVGIAGGPEKCALVTGEYGFDAAIDYKADGWREALAAATPNGIDVYFESVGGEIFDFVLTRMNTFGRIPVCGMISLYNATELPPGPKNIRSVLINRLNVRGFIVFDFITRYPEAMTALAEWHAAGTLKMREDVRDGGLEAFADVLNLLYTGGNTGKLVLRL